MRTDLPTGTVTFFFSDIEGSTRLAARLGPAFRQVIDDHNALVRAAVAPANVVEVRTVGDSFFLVFESADEAIESAIRVHKSLEEHQWPEPAAVRVRIGLHTGEGALGGDDYVGLDVHRAGLDAEWEVVERLEQEAGQLAQVVQAKYARVGLAVGEGRYEDARAMALEGLDIAEQLADRYMIAWGLEWHAMAEVELGETARAGLLLGAGQRAREAHGGGWSAAVLGIDDAATRLRSALGDHDAETAIAAGRELSLEDGLDIARNPS